MRNRIVPLLALFAVFAAACGNGDDAATTTPPPADAEAPGRAVPPPAGGTLRNQRGFAFPPAPEAAGGPLDAELVTVLDEFFGRLDTGVDVELLGEIGDSGDPRVAWLLADLLRFVPPGDVSDVAVAGFEELTGASLVDDPVALRSRWQSVTDHLIAWDLPAPPGYVGWKARLFTLVDERWEPFFSDPASGIDYRLLSWGGVRPDDRELGDPFPCPLGCIPALDDPAVTPASEGGWYPDDAVVFAVVVNGEARAYPKNIMEVHEMVNDSLGGRRIGLPYCTLCGSAQVYFTDSVPDDVAVPVLRTSGLLSRSNKVMYDLETSSVFDTFTGEALSGPLREAGIVLEQGTVIAATWGEWRAAHPETSIVARDGGIGRTYDPDPLRGRDDAGPIFPIGDVDERLPVQAQVLGVETVDGSFVAFPVDEAQVTLAAGGTVELLGIRVVADGGGLRAELADGTAVASHQAFWFAWSQFHPETLVWAPPLGG